MEPAERMVREGSASGHVVDLAELDQEQRMIDAELIRTIICSTDAGTMDERGLRLHNAHIAGQLDLSYCEIKRPLSFGCVIFDESPLLGRCHLPALDFERCQLPGLWADSIEVTSTLSFEASRVLGPMRLVGGKVGADLVLEGVSIRTRGGDECTAANMTLLHVAGTLHGRALSALGGVRMLGAHIGGSVDFSEARFQASGLEALIADGTSIGLALYLSQVEADGEVRMVGGRVGTDVLCEGATITGGLPDALTLDGLDSKGNVNLSDGFQADGIVRIVGAKIGGSLNCENAIFSSGSDNRALILDGCTIGMMMRMVGITCNGGARLFNASAAALEDDADSWRRSQPLNLTGFRYGEFAGAASWDIDQRCEWVRATENFDPASWNVLAGVYQSSGRESDAIAIRIARERDRNARGGLGWLHRIGRQGLGLLIGYGYHPSRAGLWALLVIGLYGIIVTLLPGSLQADANAPQRGVDAFVYAADTFLPIVDLGEAVNWFPRGFVRWVERFVIVLGWALSTLFVAGFTGIVRR